MLRLIPLLLVCGCVTTHDPHPLETAFGEPKRDWVAVFENEIRIAIENEDVGAYHFFMQELIKEKVRLWKEKQENKP